LAFGGGRVIAENDRGEQRKIIKYNHLLANCLIFHNVYIMTRALYKLRSDGVQIELDAVAALSPCIRSHINRFGLYAFDLDHQPPSVDYELPIFSNGARCPLRLRLLAPLLDPTTASFFAFARQPRAMKREKQ